MNPKAFARTRESLAAERPATTEAAGAAMCKELHEITMDGHAAARMAAMVSLGKKFVIYRHGGSLRERAGAVEEMLPMMTSQRTRGGNKRIPFEEAECRCIAGLALHELAHDRCPTCLGRGEVQDHVVLHLEGRQPMKVCDTCMGVKHLAAKEDDRVRNLATEWVRIFHPRAHAEERQFAIVTVAKSLRTQAKLHRMLDSADWAKALLLEAERIVVNATGRMLERT